MWGWDEGQEFSLNPDFFKYPSLTFYVHLIAQGVLYLGMNASGHIASPLDWRAMHLTDPSPLYLTARFVNVLFALATIWVVYKTARFIRDARAGSLSATLIALNSFHIARSQMVEVDITLTFFVSLALYGAARLSLNRSKSTYVLTGVAAGLAASSKYTGALLVVPIMLAHFAAWNRSRTGSSPWADLRNLAFGLGLAVLTFAVTSPYVFLDWREFVTDLLAEREHMMFGHFGLDEGPAWIFYAGLLSSDVINPLVFIAALVGIWDKVLRQRNPPALVLAGFVVLYLGVISTWAMKTDRYLLPVLPPMLVFAGVGLAATLQRCKDFLAPRLHYVAVLAILVTIVLLEGFRYANYVEGYQQDTRTDVAKWIIQHAAPGSYIVTEPYGPNLVGPPVLVSLDRDLQKQVIERIGPKSVFAVQILPMFQIRPERSGAFYNVDLYRNADYFVVSSGVASRYRREPQRFAQQIAFYDRLDRELEKVCVFVPARKDGLRLAIYGRRSTHGAFASRLGVAPPPEIAMNVGDAATRFYFDLGANYEFFGRTPEAYSSYRLALERGTDSEPLFYNCALGTARCLLLLGRRDDAIALLRSVATRSSDERTRSTLVQMAEQIGKSDKRRTP